MATDATELIPAPRKAVGGRKPYRPPAPPEPWERQPGEPAQAYFMFTEYRDEDQAIRSQARTARSLNKDIHTISRYARRYHWSDRVDAWDQFNDQAATRGRSRAVEAMNERHANISMVMQSKVAERLKTVEPEELSLRDVERWVDRSTRIERRARGIDDQPQVQVNVNQSQAQVAAAQSNAAAIAANAPSEAQRAVRDLIERDPSKLLEAGTKIVTILELVDEADGAGA